VPGPRGRLGRAHDEPRRSFTEVCGEQVTNRRGPVIPARRNRDARIGSLENLCKRAAKWNLCADLRYVTDARELMPEGDLTTGQATNPR